MARQPIGTVLASDTPHNRPRVAFVAAASAVHATGMVAALTCGDDSPVRSDLLPAALPLGEIVERLNVLQAGPSPRHTRDRFYRPAPGTPPSCLIG